MDAETIKAFKEKSEANLPAMRELFSQDAKLQWVKFSAYLEEGFSREEAIQLCVRP
jgi:hypothetical protein